MEKFLKGLGRVVERDQKLKRPPQKLSPAQALLPPEILLLIFLHIPAGFGTSARRRGRGVTGAANAALTCHVWNQAATTALYSHVFLIGFDSAVLFYRTIQSNPRLAVLVKKVEMPVLYEPNTTLSSDRARRQKRWLQDMRWPQYEVALSTLLNLCPNVTELSFAFRVYNWFPDPFTLWLPSSPDDQDLGRRFTRLCLLDPYAASLAHILVVQGGLEAMPQLRRLELHMHGDTWPERSSDDQHLLIDDSRRDYGGRFNFVLGGMRAAALSHKIYFTLLDLLSASIERLDLLQCTLPNTITDSSSHVDPSVSGFPRLRNLRLSGSPSHLPFHRLPTQDFLSTFLLPARRSDAVGAPPIAHITLVDVTLSPETFHFFSHTVTSLALKLTSYPNGALAELSPFIRKPLSLTLRTLTVDWRFPLATDVLSAWNATLPDLFGLQTLVLGQIPTGLVVCVGCLRDSGNAFLQPLLRLPPNIHSLHLDCFPRDLSPSTPVGVLQIRLLLFYCPTIDSTSNAAVIRMAATSVYPDLKDVEIHLPFQRLNRQVNTTDIVSVSVQDLCEQSGIKIRVTRDEANK